MSINLYDILKSHVHQTDVITLNLLHSVKVIGDIPNTDVAWEHLAAMYKSANDPRNRDLKRNLVSASDTEIVFVNGNGERHKLTRKNLAKRIKRLDEKKDIALATNTKS